MSLTDALRALSAAHGGKALAGAFHALQGQVRQTRRAAKAQYGNLAQTFMAAMQIWDAQKAEGVSREGRLAGLEKTLRASWPQAREWKYLCQECGDIGLVSYDCSGRLDCGRHREHLPHSYGRPCFCSKGARFSEKPKPEPADFKQAGLTKVGKR